MKRLLFFSEPTKKDKRLAAVFYIDGKIKVINFGSQNGETFIDHVDIKKKRNWIARHQKNIDKFKNDPLAPITLAQQILWNKHTLDDSVADYKEKFNL